MRGSNKSNRKTSGPRPVERVELSEEHKKIRGIAVIVLVLIAAIAFGNGVRMMVSKEEGWIQIEGSSSDTTCAGDFVFNYYLGRGDISATAENKAVTAVYMDAAKTAYENFSAYEKCEGVNNLWYINHNPNVTVEVSGLLYDALLRASEDSNRWVFLGPVYDEYLSLWFSSSDEDASQFDPVLNAEEREYFDILTGFISSEEDVSLEFLSENRIILNISEEYLKFASEYGIENFLEFGWLKNAFIIDYFAERLTEAGYTNGYISSADGRFVRNLDDSGEEYNFVAYKLENDTVSIAQTMSYSGKCAVLSMYGFPISKADKGQYYVYSNGRTITPYIDAEDGLSKCAYSTFVISSEKYSCTELALKAAPYFIREKEAASVGIPELGEDITVHAAM